MAQSTVRLDLECLEERFAPATWGNPWPDAAHMTLSFAPDGTQVGDHQSQMFQTLNAQLKTNNPAAWEQAILRAFQTWAVNANINVSVQSDGGQPFGTTGAFQGDSRFGDIRAAAFPMTADQVTAVEPLAMEEPFDPLAGTWTGDLSLNTAYRFGFNKANSYDLYSVALHEAGHVFGLNHSPNTADVMYEDYLGARAGLSSNDIARLQALYGTRTADAGSNDSFGSATPIPLALTSSVLPNNGDISSPTDKDFYKVLIGVMPGGATLQLKTTGISSLMARVTVYDSSYNVIQSVVSTDPMHGDLSINLPGSLFSSLTYYIKVESGTIDVFGVGSYQLQVVSNVLPLPSATSLLNAVDAVGNSLTSALGLPQLIPTTDARFDYAYKSSISSSSDVDYYSITSPAPPAGMANVMTVYVWGLDSRSLDPAVSVYDAQGNPLSTKVLTHENDTMVIQYAPEPGNSLYYVKVAAANPSGPNNVGNYFLGIDFNTALTPVPALTFGSVSSTAAANPFTLTVTQDLIGHFILSASSATAPANAAVQMTVYDQNGTVVYTLSAMAGDTRSLTCFLAKGTYTIKFTAVSTNGATPPLLSFNLSGLNISEPIDPYPMSSTKQPSDSGGGSPPPPSPPPSSTSSSPAGPSSTATW